MTAGAASPRAGILSRDSVSQRDELIELLKTAYWMEIETVMSYIANSINPDGVRAREVVENLEQDIQEELGHAQQFGENRGQHFFHLVAWHGPGPLLGGARSR